jgi:hypothetical protein
MNTEVRGASRTARKHLQNTYRLLQGGVHSRFCGQHTLILWERIRFNCRTAIRQESEEFSRYGLKGPGSIPGNARFFSSSHRSDRHWCPPRLLPNECHRYNSNGLKLTTHLHRVPRLRRLELFLHFPMSSWHSD